MPKPAPKPSMTKAPSKEHPYQPAPPTVVSVPRPAAALQSGTEKVFSTRLSADLVRQVKTHAAATDTSVQAVVTAALTAYLEQP